jgi:Uma2 family endonuclease
MANPSLLEEIVAGRAPGIVLLSVEQYHQLQSAEVLPEGLPIELIDGLLVRKDRSSKENKGTNHSPRHAGSVARIQRYLDQRMLAYDGHARCQLPVTLTDDSEPEPDVALVAGPPGAYETRHPGPADILAAVEVADSSLAFDRSVKQRLYATARIPTYLIVNLIDRQIEVYEAPDATRGRYAQRTDFKPGETAQLPLRGSEPIELPIVDILSDS